MLVILNGIDVDSFTPDANRRDSTRLRMGIATDSKEFIWIAVGHGSGKRLPKSAACLRGSQREET